jgi:hypothetical protein
VLLTAECSRYCPSIFRCFCCCIPIVFAITTTTTTTTTNGNMEEEDPTRISEEWKTLSLHGMEEWKSRPDSMYALEDSFAEVNQHNSSSSSSSSFSEGNRGRRPWSIVFTSVRWQSSIMSPSITASPLQVGGGGGEGVELTANNSTPASELKILV